MVVGLMPYFLSPIGTSCHFAYAADARFVFASVAKQTPGRVVFRKAYISHLSRGIFR